MSAAAATQTIQRALAEALGTFFLVLIGPGAAMVNAWSDGALGHAGVALAFGGVVAAMIFALGHLSGAHVNPAVTLAFWATRRFPGREVLPYIIAQIIGATTAAYALRGIIGDAANNGATIPAIPVGAAFALEWFLSFALMFVIMAVATDDRSADGFAALAVGATVGFCAMMGGPLTGASMNPARSLGPAIAGSVWTHHWLYWIAPVSAMIAAAFAYELLRGVHPPRGSAEREGVQGPLDSPHRH